MRIHHLLGLALLALLPREAACCQELEQFRLRNEPLPLSARVLSWDFQRSTLTLELADGSTRVVPAADLHLSDRRIVERTLKRQLLDGRNAGDARAVPAASDPGRLPPDTTRIGGVPWIAGPGEALKTAAGRDGIEDDKPLVWFRVLGDLNGFL